MAAAVVFGGDRDLSLDETLVIMVVVAALLPPLARSAIPPLLCFRYLQGAIAMMLRCCHSLDDDDDRFLGSGSLYPRTVVRCSHVVVVVDDVVAVPSTMEI